jgi:hypothetical protein
MLQDFLTSIFESHQLTGSEHIHITTLLFILGMISAVVWSCIALSIVIRHFVIFVIRISAHNDKEAGIETVRKKL